jgi:Flp pilus assembly protein protease CpaA
MNKFQMALATYAILAVLAWLTLSATVDVDGRTVPIVWIVWALLAMFALRTWLHHQRARLIASSDSEGQR